MSKTDDLRAMREARYEAATKRAAKSPAAPTAPTAPRPASKRTVKAEAVPTPSSEPVPEGLCGHRAISGRTCTRESGHAAKSHRYS